MPAKIDSNNPNKVDEEKNLDPNKPIQEEMINNGNEETFQEKMDRLLSNKAVADLRVRTAMKHRAIFSGIMDEVDENGKKMERIICFIKRNESSNRLLKYIEQAEKANEELLEFAPMHFNRNTPMFRLPVVRRGVVDVSVSIHNATSTKLDTGERIAKMIRLHLRTIEAKLVYENDPEKKRELEETIERGLLELKYYESNPDKKIRRRSNAPSKDVVVLLRMADYFGKNAQANTREKLHAHSGGVVLIRSSYHEAKEINIIDTSKKKKNSSVYDNLQPLKTILPFNYSLYDEDLVNLERANRAKLKIENELKIRPKNDTTGI